MYPYRKPFPGRGERIVKYDTHIRPLFSTFSAPGGRLPFRNVFVAWGQIFFPLPPVSPLSPKTTTAHYLIPRISEGDFRFQTSVALSVSSSSSSSFFSSFSEVVCCTPDCRCGYCYKIYPLTAPPGCSRSLPRHWQLFSLLADGQHTNTLSDDTSSQQTGGDDDDDDDAPGGWFHYLLSCCCCSFVWERIAPWIARCALLQDIFRKPNNLTHLHGLLLYDYVYYFLLLFLSWGYTVGLILLFLTGCFCMIVCTAALS